MTQPTTNPVGRPSSIHHVVAHLPILDSNGQPTGETRPVTAAERIIQHVRTGGYIETAAATAGVAKSTVHRWLREGARILDQLDQTPDDERQHMWDNLTDTQRAYAEFSHSVAKAEAEALAEDIGRLQQLARGGHTITTVTEKVDANGQLIERTTKTETVAPSAQVLQWRLERRHPDLFGRHRVEITGADGGPVELTVTEKRQLLLQQLIARAEALNESDALLASYGE